MKTKEQATAHRHGAAPLVANVGYFLGRKWQFELGSQVAIALHAKLLIIQKTTFDTLYSKKGKSKSFTLLNDDWKSWTISTKVPSTLGIRVYHPELSILVSWSLHLQSAITRNYEQSISFVVIPLLPHADDNPGIYLWFLECGLCGGIIEFQNDWIHPCLPILTECFTRANTAQPWGLETWGSSLCQGDTVYVDLCNYFSFVVDGNWIVGYIILSSSRSSICKCWHQTWFWTIRQH